MSYSAKCHFAQGLRPFKFGVDGLKVSAVSQNEQQLDQVTFVLHGDYCPYTCMTCNTLACADVSDVFLPSCAFEAPRCHLSVLEYQLNSQRDTMEAWVGEASKAVGSPLQVTLSRFQPATVEERQALVASTSLVTDTGRTLIKSEMVVMLPDAGMHPKHHYQVRTTYDLRQVKPLSTSTRACPCPCLNPA